MASSNVSPDLIWQIVNGSNSLLVKRKEGGGVKFSRDPFNLMNKHSRKYEGFVSDKAIGIHASEDGKVVLSTKNPKEINHPSRATSVNKTFKRGAAPRKIYRVVAATTAKQGYRPDLRGAAIARASRIKYSQNPKGDAPVRKSRSAKARKAAAAA